MVGRPFDSIADDLKRIADAISGAEDYEGAADKAHRALSRIADYIEENGLGSSAKLDEIIEDKGVGVKTVKPDEEVLDLTVEAADWTVEASYIAYYYETEIALEGGVMYAVNIDGTVYNAVASESELGTGVWIDDGEGNTICNILTTNGHMSIMYFDTTAADHTFVVSKVNSFTVEFETPEAAEWDTSDVPWVKIPSIALVQGNEYTVTWDGVEYAVTCREVSETLVIGNANIVDDTAEDTGEPFLMGEYDYYESILNVKLENVGVHSVSVTYTAYDYQQIDEKYIPSSGLQLYGPYYANNAESVSVEDGHSISGILTIYSDAEGNLVSFPVDTPFNAYLTGFYSGDSKCVATSVYAPAYSDSYGGLSNATIDITNFKGSDVTLSAGALTVAFLSTVELTVAESEG